MLGFLAIYLPALLLFGVIVISETETTVETGSGAQTVTGDSAHRSATVSWTILALGPAAAGLAWWWAGRAVRPIDRVRAVTEVIEGTDLSRRIALTHGPGEVVSLAASVDGMLDRLERSAQTQRRLIEETSHELRTPLAVLLANAEVILAHPKPTLDVYRQGLERSQATATRLERTINELLVDARGRARTIDRRPADVMAIARDTIADATVLAEAKRTSVTCTGPPTALCPVEASSVRRAISNLIDNAIRYGPSDSTVEVVVDVNDQEVAVSVFDHGPGIPEDEQGLMLGRFWRGRSDVPGTGLGLSIVNHVALAHGGDLSVTSPGPTGDGSVFRLTLHR
jgi:signal transduction histidine kinase